MRVALHGIRNYGEDIDATSARDEDEDKSYTFGEGATDNSPFLIGG